MASLPARDQTNDHLPTPKNCALIVIDYQPIQVGSAAPAASTCAFVGTIPTCGADNTDCLSYWRNQPLLSISYHWQKKLQPKLA
jgi:hypothetical protein